LESPGNALDGIDNDGDNAADGVAPYFAPDFFAPDSFDTGDQIVLIDDETYERLIFTITEDTTEVYSQGRVVQIITTAGAKTIFREDIRNLLDDNFNGIIDEDTLNHYANRVNRTIDNIAAPLLPYQYVDYFANIGSADLMLDERRDDGIDNDGDWDPTNDDVGLDGVPLTYDFGEDDGIPTS
ncbi:MAG: hypothetical protein L3J79_08090, partial [Candidatus Marinimicrobia bacterium]|nr:hypothetical protein [Candidatus Neomarinimicrobiota bacterium]